jgi:serine/threonine-protein kinase
MNIKNYLWITPFLSFIAGYLLMHSFFSAPITLAPALVGKQIHAILPLLTEQKLNLRLLYQKEEADLPEGIIINQTPAAGTSIKQNQPIFVVTTKRPLAQHAPQCVGTESDQLHHKLQAEGITPRIYQLPHPYPEKICFAQSPQPGECLEKNRLIVYISSGNNKPIIWPDFTHLPLPEVIDFLRNYNIEPYIISDYADKNYYNNQECIVIDQRPFAGTLLTIDEQKPLSVQLRVTEAYS